MNSTQNINVNSTSKNAALFVATLSSFLTAFAGSSVNVAIPSIARDFSINAVLLSWVVISFTLGAVVFLVPLGRIADIHGRKKIFTLGTITYTLGSLLAGISGSASFIIASRLIQGLGGAMVFGTGIAIVTSVYPPAEKGKALGINIAGVYCGLSSGPFFGGILTQYLGWRSVFLINIPMGLIILAFILWKLKGEWAESRGDRFDLTGSVIYGIMIITIMYGFSVLPDMIGAWLIVVGAVSGAAFIIWETKTKSPVLNIGLFRNNTVFKFSNLAALINYSATFAIGFLLSLYLQYIKGLSPQNAGIVLVSQPIVMAIFSPFAGRLSDRIEPRIVASAGMTLTTIGLSFFIFVSSNTPMPLIITGLIFVGFGFALFSSPNTNAIMSSVEKKHYGVASATLGTMRLLGQMLSLGVASLLFSLFIGRVQITPEYYPFFLKSVKTAFLIFSVLCLGGIFASLARGNLRQSNSFYNKTKSP